MWKTFQLSMTPKTIESYATKWTIEIIVYYKKLIKK
jgi:hypothetical protein